MSNEAVAKHLRSKLAGCTVVTVEYENNKLCIYTENGCVTTLDAQSILTSEDYQLLESARRAKEMEPVPAQVAEPKQAAEQPKSAVQQAAEQGYGLCRSSEPRRTCRW